MNGGRLLVAWCFLGLLACQGRHGLRRLSAEELAGGDPLPLAAGARWSYVVTQVTYDPATETESKNEFDWTTSVIDATPGDGFVAYRISGWVGDAAFGAKPEEKILLRSYDRFVWAQGTSKVPDGGSGWFAWPLADGQEVCPDPNTELCWRVTSSEYGYYLRSVEGRDEHEYLVQPGTGVAQYTRTNEGTTNKLQATLTGYQPGRRAE